MLIVVTRTKPTCVYCLAVKNLLATAGVEYLEVPIESVKEDPNFLKTGWKSVPAVFKDYISPETLIGGATETQNYVYQS